MALTIAIGESERGVVGLYRATLSSLGTVYMIPVPGSTPIFPDQQGVCLIATPNNGDLIDVVNQYSVDLAIVQGMNPDLPGPAVIRALREGGYKGLVAIASSDYDMVQQGLYEGANFVIPKPFSPVKLLELIKTNLGI